MNYSIYKKSTGQILRIVQTPNIEIQLQQDESYIEGSYNDTEYYIADNIAVQIPEKTSAYSRFDYSTKQWVLVPELAIEEIRIKRKHLLTGTDWIDTLSAKSRLGDSVYNQWQLYRQALRDIPAQSGYPYNVAWPTTPV